MRCMLEVSDLEAAPLVKGHQISLFIQLQSLCKAKSNTNLCNPASFLSDICGSMES